MGVDQAYRPILRSPRHRPAARRSGAPTTGILPVPAVDVGSCIPRILQDAEHPAAVGWPPYYRVRGRSPQRPHRQFQSGAPQGSHDGVGASQVMKQVKDQMEARLYFLIGIEDDRTAAFLRQTGGQGLAQLPACRLLTLALVQANLDLVQFRLAHDPGQPEQQPVVIGTWIEQALAVGDQHAEQGAQFHQLVPVPVVPGQARSIQAEHEAGVPKTDLGDQPLEAVPAVAGGARAPEILVDHLDPLPGPAQLQSAVNQAILQLGALLVLPNLGDR